MPTTRTESIAPVTRSVFRWSPARCPWGATIIGLPLAAAMFTTGWTFQFVGHAFEGKKPIAFDDKRALLVGLIWWLKAGLDLVELSD